LNEVHRPSTMEESKKAWLEAIQHDESIRDTLARATGAWPQIGEIDLTDSDGRIRASSRDEMIGRQHVPVPLFETWKGMSLLSNVAQLLEQLKDAVRLFDTAGKLMMAGRAVRHLLGCEPDTLMGRRTKDIFPPETRLGLLVAQALEKREGVRDRLVPIVTSGV